MFEVFYRKNIITINFHHCITDGTGGVNFFLELLFGYFSLRGDNVETEGVLRPSAAPHVFDEAEDTFRIYDKKKDKISLFELVFGGYIFAALSSGYHVLFAIFTDCMFLLKNI